MSTLEFNLCRSAFSPSFPLLTYCHSEDLIKANLLTLSSSSLPSSYSYPTWGQSGWVSRGPSRTFRGSVWWVYLVGDCFVAKLPPLIRWSHHRNWGRHWHQWVWWRSWGTTSFSFFSRKHFILLSMNDCLGRAGLSSGQRLLNNYFLQISGWPAVD